MMIGKLVKTLLVTCVALTSSAFAAVWNGYADITAFNNYSYKDTFKISTPEQLAGLQKYIEDYDGSFRSKTVVLTADIFLNDTTKFFTTYITNLRNWTPIGRHYKAFYGTFDGKGHTIYGLRSTTSQVGGNGLFGYATDATIRNLNLKYAKVKNGNTGAAATIVADGMSSLVQNVHVEKCSVSVDSTQAVGGLTARFFGRIESSSVNGDVVGKDTVGGLVGRFSLGSPNQYNLLTSSNNGIISSSSFKGTIKGRSTIGGLVGYSKGTILSSSAEGSIDGEYIVNKNKYRTYRTGGLVGKHEGNIQSSFFKGNVAGYDSIGGLVGVIFGNVIGTAPSSCTFSGSVKGEDYLVGGIAGKADSILSACAEGDVKSNINGGRYVGGVVGEASLVRGSFHINGNVVGSAHVGGVAGNAKNVSNSYHENGTVNGSWGVGGLVGYADSVINSYSKGNVSGNQYSVGGLVGGAIKIVESYSIGNVDGGAAYSVGGLAGSVSGSVKKSMSMGSVSGKDSVGGLVGRFNGSIIEDAYSRGAVTGSKYVGGLVGVAKDSLKRTYAIGAVTGSANYGCVAGGVITSKTLKESNTYYDSDSCSSGTYTAVGSATTLSKIKTSYPFTSWDASTWLKVNGAYPVLFVYAGSIAAADITLANANNIMYDGTAKKPKVTVKAAGVTLDSSKYSVTYKNNVGVGTASAEICGKSPYFGCKVVNFQIKKNSTVPTITVADQVYTGSALKPSVKVYIGTELMNSGTYSVTYSNNTKAGTASVTVTMIGNYTGKATKTFKIEKASLSVSANPTASVVANGAKLSTSTLTGGKVVRAGSTTTVSGKFVWVSKDTIPTISNNGYQAVFHPSDSANYKYSEEVVVPVVVKIVAVFLDRNGKVFDSLLVDYKTKVYMIRPPEVEGYEFSYYVDYNTAQYCDEPLDACWMTASKNMRIESNYTRRSFVIRFMLGDSVLQMTSAFYGNKPYYGGATPTKESNNQYEYKFAGWNPALEYATKAQDYQAVFDSVLIKYTITFKRGTEVFSEAEVAYGTVPTEPADILPAKTAQYTYSLKWDKKFVAVTGNATYTATIDSTLNKYAVTFKDADGTVLKDSIYNYGTAAANLVTPTPTKAATAKYTYTFKGWKPTVSEVVKEAIYVAEYDSTLNKYAVKFMNGSDLLDSQMVAYGEVPEFAGETPAKTSDSYTYTFEGWSPEIVPVTETVVYTAVFDSVQNHTTRADVRLAGLNMSVSVVAKNIQISAAPIGANYMVMDVQGRVLKNGKVESDNFSIPMALSGNYLVKVGSYSKAVKIR